MNIHLYMHVHIKTYFHVYASNERQTMIHENTRVIQVKQFRRLLLVGQLRLDGSSESTAQGS